MRRRLLMLTGAVALASCNDATGPLEGRKRLEVSTSMIDARNGGSSGFYFLPPVAASVVAGGVFDPGRAPVVEVCALASAGCGDLYARFTMTGGPGSERIRVNVVDESYSVQWHTRQTAVVAGATYRIRVLEGSTELGHADVGILANASQSRSLPAGTIGVVAGATIPIKFRIEVQGGGAPVRLEINPGTFLLPGAGATLPLQVIAYDANGQQVDPGPVSWQSAKPSVVGVSSTGIATAILSSGSTQITAQAGGLTSAPALGVVAQPAPGALLITDANVVTQSPAFASGGARLQTAVTAAPAAAGVIVPVDPTAPYKPGWLYKVLLNGVTPVPGQILISQGEAAIGGRVVSVTAVGDDVEVTLALVAIADMLPGLSVEESFELEEIPIEIPAEILAGYSVTRSTGGRMSFQSRAPRSFGFASDLGNSVTQASLLDSESEIALGPFDCKVTTSGTPLSPVLTNSSFHIDPDLTFDLNYSPANGLQRLVVRGAIDAGVTVTPVFPLEVEEKIACEVQLATIHLPVGGPLALFVGGEVPVGVGFEMGGKLTAANLGVEASITAGAAMTLGIDCSAGCSPVGSVTGSATGYFKPIIPDITADIRIELSATGFTWAKLEVGNPFIEGLRFEAFEGKAGLKQVALLGSTKGQVSDPAFASSFKFSFDIEAATGSGLNKLGELLGISMSAMKLEHSELLAQSPRATTFTITPGSVDAMTATYAGEKAKFDLTLSPVTYMGGYAVDSILLYRKKPGAAGDFTLEKVPGGCGQLAAASGQSSFSCEAALPASWAGEQTIHAFVRPRIFGVGVPLLLELKEDAKATVTVDTATIEISPATANLAPGADRQFSATVTGVTNTDVTWTVTGGTHSGTGNTITYTAGGAQGMFVVRATSVENASLVATAQVTIGSSCSPSTTPPCTGVTINPGNAVVRPGSSRQFTAFIPGGGSQNVVWSASGGTITSDGLFTAGTEIGLFQVNASSSADPSLQGSASVLVSQATITLGRAGIGIASYASTDWTWESTMDRNVDQHFADRENIDDFDRSTSTRATISWAEQPDGGVPGGGIKAGTSTGESETRQKMILKKDPANLQFLGVNLSAAATASTSGTLDDQGVRIVGVNASGELNPVSWFDDEGYPRPEDTGIVFRVTDASVTMEVRATCNATRSGADQAGANSDARVQLAIGRAIGSVLSETGPLVTSCWIMAGDSGPKSTVYTAVLKPGFTYSIGWSGYANTNGQVPTSASVEGTFSVVFR